MGCSRDSPMRNSAFEALIQSFQRETFDSQRGLLTNRISVFGLNAIIAKVYKQASWFDGQECIVLDYSETSTVAKWVRDEIRQIEPNLYLGIVYYERTKLIDFCLEFSDPQT